MTHTPPEEAIADITGSMDNGGVSALSRLLISNIPEMTGLILIPNLPRSSVTQVIAVLKAVITAHIINRDYEAE